MSLHIRAKNGKTTTISAFQILKDPIRARATIEGIKRRHARKSSSSPKEEKKDETAPKTEDKPVTITEAKAEETPEEFQKNRAKLLSQLKALDVSAFKEVAEANKGKLRTRIVPPSPPIIPVDASRVRSASVMSKKPFAGIQEGGKFMFDPGEFDPSDMPDADPSLHEAKATQADIENSGGPAPERRKLTLAQCGLMMRLDEYYDKIKYETIASRFFDCTLIRVSSEEMKYMIEGEHAFKNSA